MKDIRIALVGAAGRMGIEITRAIVVGSDVCVGAAIEASTSPAVGADIGVLAGVGPLEVPVTTDLRTAAAHCDVIVDVSLPVATAANIEAAVQAAKPLVCGTTGVPDEILKQFDAASRTIPVIHTKNFSLGIAVLASLATAAARALGEDYDVEIIEAHHRRKVDAPSGTAEILADAIAVSGESRNVGRIYGRSGHTGQRPSGEIAIHAVRGGGIFGDHTVIFAGEHERLEITHRAETRSLFAQGAVRTAIFLARATPGRYTMADVLKG